MCKLYSCLYMIITGGVIEADSIDDCIDANGILEISGGIVKAAKSKGTVVGFNAALSGDEVRICPGASMLVALGNPGEVSVDCDQNAVLVYFETAHDAGETVILSDSEGTEQIRYTLPMSCSAVYASSPVLSDGGIYSVEAGDECVSVVIDGSFTTVGEPAADTVGNGYSWSSDTDGESSEGNGGFQWQSHWNGGN